MVFESFYLGKQRRCFRGGCCGVSGSRGSGVQGQPPEEGRALMFSLRVRDMTCTNVELWHPTNGNSDLSVTAGFKETRNKLTPPTPPVLQNPVF